MPGLWPTASPCQRRPRLARRPGRGPSGGAGSDHRGPDRRRPEPGGSPPIPAPCGGGRPTRRLLISLGALPRMPPTLGPGAGRRAIWLPVPLTLIGIHRTRRVSPSPKWLFSEQLFRSKSQPACEITRRDNSRVKFSSDIHTVLARRSWVDPTLHPRLLRQRRIWSAVRRDFGTSNSRQSCQ